MTHEKFNEIIENQLKNIKEILIIKGKEYCKSLDRIDCFEKAANIQQCSIKKALAGMMCKHTVSIYDMIASDEKYSFDKWKEKITDNINYLLILLAIVKEEE